MGNAEKNLGAVLAANDAAEESGLWCELVRLLDAGGGADVAALAAVERRLGVAGQREALAKALAGARKYVARLAKNSPAQAREACRQAERQVRETGCAMEQASAAYNAAHMALVRAGDRVGATARDQAELADLLRRHAVLLAAAGISAPLA